VTPRRLDAATVAARLRLIHDALDDLAQLGDVDADRLRSDRLARRVVERCLAHVVDTAAAVNAHLVGAALGHAPRDLADSFDLAVEAGVLPADLGARLRNSAGMRNVIVHAYQDLDLDRVAAAVPQAQTDFRA
jgi:uncharacterized protein YutE (UPF0331/DUF86 family)